MVFQFSRIGLVGFVEDINDKGPVFSIFSHNENTQVYSESLGINSRSSFIFRPIFLTTYPNFSLCLHEEDLVKYQTQEYFEDGSEGLESKRIGLASFVDFYILGCYASERLPNISRELNQGVLSSQDKIDFRTYQNVITKEFRKRFTAAVNKRAANGNNPLHDLQARKLLELFPDYL